MWYWGTGVQWWAWGLGIFTTILFWGLVVWAIVALVNWTRGRNGPNGSGGPAGPHGMWPIPGGRPAGDAEEILARRFAAGEIGAEEYRHRLEVLRARFR